MRILLLLSTFLISPSAFAVNLNCSLVTSKSHQRFDSLMLEKAETRTNVDNLKAKLVYVATVYVPSYEGTATVVLDLEDRVSGQSSTQWFDVDLSKPQPSHGTFRLVMKNKKGLGGSKNEKRADLICDLETKTQKKGEEISPPL